MRVVFWLFIISAIVPITVASTVVTGLIFFTPVIDNQSISAWVPQYMYIVGILVSIAFFLLSLGAIGSLFKQRRINKTLALLATIIILAGAVVSAGTAYKTMMLAMSHHTIVKQELIVAASTMSGDRVNLDLTKINSNNDRWDTMLGNADILLIRTTGTDIKVMVESTLRGRSDEELESIASKLIPLTMTGDKNNIEVGRQPNAKIFSEEVPLSMVQRHVVISVPANQEVYINKNRRVNMAVQNDASDVRVSYCDAKVYVYNEDMNEFTCKDDVWYDEAYDHIDMEGIIEDRVSERAHQRMNQSFDAVPPMYPENETGSDKDQ